MYDDKLWVKYAMPLQDKCNQIFFWGVQEQFKNTSIDVVAIKCTPFNQFKLDKKIYSYETYE